MKRTSDHRPPKARKDHAVRFTRKARLGWTMVTFVLPRTALWTSPRAWMTAQVIRTNRTRADRIAHRVASADEHVFDRTAKHRCAERFARAFACVKPRPRWVLRQSRKTLGVRHQAKDTATGRDQSCNSTFTSVRTIRVVRSGLSRSVAVPKRDAPSTFKLLDLVRIP